MNIEPVDDRSIIAVCAADENYAMPLAVMAYSALANLKASCQLTLFVIDGGITAKSKQKIMKTLSSDRCEVKFLPQPNSFAKSIEQAYKYTMTEGQGKHLAIASCYKLMIANVLPKEIEKVIFLDCDLVIEGDLAQLWQSDLGDNYVLAARDTWIHSVSAANGLLNYKDLKIDPSAKYFNSGVFLANLKQWRREEFFVKAVEYLDLNKEYIRFGDQDILNSLFAGKWDELDLRWNVTPGIYEYDSWEESSFSETVYNNALNDPYIIHFAAGFKPWNSDRVRSKERFFHYIDMTAWSGWRFTPCVKIQRKLACKFKNLVKMMSGQEL